jgi:molybdopterin-binding protein
LLSSSTTSAAASSLMFAFGKDVFNVFKSSGSTKIQNGKTYTQ